MRVKTIAYAMLRKTQDYENDRVEVRIELEEGNDPVAVIARAKRLCEAALKTPAAAESLSDSKNERPLEFD